MNHQREWLDELVPTLLIRMRGEQTYYLYRDEATTYPIPIGSSPQWTLAKARQMARWHATHRRGIKVRKPRPKRYRPRLVSRPDPEPTPKRPEIERPKRFRGATFG